MNSQKFFVQIQMLRDKFNGISHEEFEEKVEDLLWQKRAILEEFRLNRKRKAFSDFLRTKDVDFVEKYEDLDEKKKSELIHEYLQEVQLYLKNGKF